MHTKAKRNQNYFQLLFTLDMRHFITETAHTFGDYLKAIQRLLNHKHVITISDGSGC